jgi:hypothetical protein
MTSAKPESANSGNVTLADEEAVKQVLVDSVLGLWDVVNNLTRLRPSRRDRYRVTIFGSARSTMGAFAYEETKRAAAALAELGCDIITGGGPGLMQAANEGAASAPEAAKSVGIRVDLPFEQDVNAFETQAFEHRTFFTRLHQFVLTSDAYIVAPGGIWDRSGNVDDLVTTPGKSFARHAPAVGRPYVACTSGLGADRDDVLRSADGEPRGL